MVAKNKTYKFATLKANAQKEAAKRQATPKVKPFVLDDVQPPISIDPPDPKRALEISEYIGADGTFHMSRARPLLKAMCGVQFGRVWELIPDNDDTASELIAGLVQAMFEHFNEDLAEALEAKELPGGTKAS